MVLNGHYTSWGAMVESGFNALIGIGIGLIFITLISFIGFELILNIPGASTFWVGLMAIRKMLYGQQLVTGESTIVTAGKLFPGFFQCIGFVLTGIITGYILFLIYEFFTDTNNEVSISHARALDTVAGIIPLLMVSKYIAAGL